MTLARWQATVTDDEGNVLPAATVEVRREVSGAPLAALFSDRDGLTGMGNPFAADLEGFAAFHVAGGAYRITATSGAFSRVWRYVAVGLGAETDGVVPGVPFLFDSGVNDEDPGAGDFRFDNSTPSLATQIFISTTSALSVDVSAWLASLDDGGNAADRGTLVLQNVDGSGAVIARVTGSLTIASGYIKIPVTILSATAADTFIAGVRFGVSFLRAGGGGDVVGPALGSPGVAAGEIAVFSDASGTRIDGSGVLASELSTGTVGRHTIFVPARAMVPRQTNGPAVVTFEQTTNDIMEASLGFDPTTAEAAQFYVWMPKNWDEGVVRAKFIWHHPTAVTNFGVTWRIAARAYGDGDAIDAAMGTAVSVSDTGATANTFYVTSETGDITIAGTPQEGDFVIFEVSRNPADAGDTLAVDALLWGVQIYYNTTADTDD